MTDYTVRRIFLLILVGAISVAFVAMLRPFLLTIFLAAIFTGVSYPAYRRILVAFRGRRVAAAVAVLLLLLTLVIVPLLSVLGVAANEALRVSQTVRPAIQRLLDQSGELDSRLMALPGADLIEPYREQILNQVLTKTAELVRSTGNFLFDALSATTRATVLFIFHFFVLLYTMFFFFLSGPQLLAAVSSHFPLTESEREQVLGRFVSVTRATLKGTVVIGSIQGTLGGLAFWAAGIDGAIFWGMVMTVLSIVPGVGSAFVWVPAVIVLGVQDHLWQAAGLLVFCVVVISSVDNVLRPWLVGRDAQMHDLMIFFSTLGGILLFGASGFIVGPILAALFLTGWEVFATAFQPRPQDPPLDANIPAG